MHACILIHAYAQPFSAAVTNASASVDVILQNATSHKMIAKGRYTEQAPHTIRARASAYFNTAASKARSAVHRLQTAAEGALQRNGSVAANLSAAKVSEQTESVHTESDQMQDVRQKAMATLTSAGAAVKAAAHRLQVAADNTLRSSSGDSQQAETNSADNNSDSTEVGNYCSFEKLVDACTLSRKSLLATLITISRTHVLNLSLQTALMV